MTRETIQKLILFCVFIHILYFVFVFVVYLEEDDKTGDPEASKEGVVDHIEDCDL